MATNSINTNPSQETTACPFCGNLYKKLGNHLPRCKKRDNRDYSAYLSKKTLDKRNSKGRSKFCPKCHRKFLRLDTHMKRNPHCKTVQDQTTEPQIVPEHGMDDSTVPEMQESTLGQSVSPPQSRSEPNSVFSTPSINLSFNLPTTTDEWNEADEYFMEHLKPKVDRAQSVEEKNDILASGIYSYFSEKYGTRQLPEKKAKHPKHQRALKKVTSLKNQARKDYRRAKSAGFPPDEILALARNFYTLIRQHNSLRETLTFILPSIPDSAATGTSGNLLRNCLRTSKPPKSHHNSQKNLLTSIFLRRTNHRIGLSIYLHGCLHPNHPLSSLILEKSHLMRLEQ